MARFDFDTQGLPERDDYVATMRSDLLAVDVEDVKRRLRLPCDCDDESDFEIESFIRSNQLDLEHFFEYSLLDTSWTFSFRGFPIRSHSYTGANLFIPWPPTRIVDSVEYYDVDEVLQTLPAADFRATTRSLNRLSDVQVIADAGWPQTGNRLDQVIVKVRSGVQTAAEVDFRIKDWLIRKTVHDFRDGRDAVSERRHFDVLHAFERVERLLRRGQMPGNHAA